VDADWLCLRDDGGNVPNTLEAKDSELINQRTMELIRYEIISIVGKFIDN
jgi:hypothetical protein